MPESGEQLVAKIQCGLRAKAIRDVLGIDQDEMAERLTAKAAELGFAYNVYDKGKVSKSETGGRYITAEDAVTWAALDPERRGVVWLVAGLPLDGGGEVRVGGNRRRA